MAVILDIFAQHATSREGMMQVELALLRYHLPRLRGQGSKLSRQAGGIGSRGPGETKLETDRRRITQRMAQLERELKELRQVRETQRKARRRSNAPTGALVGYTNAGKSTLLNALTEAGGSDREPTVLHARFHNSKVATPGRPGRPLVGHRRLRTAPAPPTHRSIPLDVAGGGRRRPPAPRRRRVRPDRHRPDRRRS